MKVLIIGNNNINSSVSNYFSDRNIDTTIISDVNDIRKLIGEVGNFILQMKNEDIKADYVIFTEQPCAKPLEICGLRTLSLNQNNITDTLTDNPKGKSSQPVVFLLDYIDESPMIASIQALNDALLLARKKFPVYYLARFIRTAGFGIESLYKDARETGINFIKYESIDITVDLHDETFYIDVSDDELNFEIDTKTIYSDGGWDVGERLTYAVKALNLTPNSLGYLTEDSFFLTPALTSRQGVFYITRDHTYSHSPQRFHEILDFILSQMSNDPNNDSTKNSTNRYAEINEKKCVLCYNCYRACPHAGLEADSEINKMKCLVKACRECGICINICPANAITLNHGFGQSDTNKNEDENNNPATISNPVPDKSKKQIHYCKNSGGIYLKDIISDPNEFTLDIKELSCGGQITSKSILAHSNEYSKILYILCPDNACQHFTGNKRTCASINRLKSIMNTSGISNDKTTVKLISPGMPKILQEEVSDFINKP